MDVPSNLISNLIKGKTTTNDTVTASEDPVAAQYDTITKETDAPVEHKHVHEEHEEKVQKVVEKERHQDHYHTTVQPLQDKEVRPEQHEYKEAATREKTFNHEDDAATQAKLAEEKARFESTKSASKNETKTDEGTVVGDEHVHHHFHETIQPVIEKEVVKPTTTHTTIPVHETHQDASVVHGTDTATPMSVDEFKAAGNKLNE